MGFARPTKARLARVLDLMGFARPTKARLARVLDLMGLAARLKRAEGAREVPR
jgi:hypothetical protein